MKSPQHHTKNSNPTGLRNILLLAVLFISGLPDGWAQSIQYPKVVKQTAANVLITEIKTTASKTKISFVYYNATEDRRQYFYLHAPGDLDVLYIKANGKIYKLLSTEDIANRDGVTYADPKETYSFSAYFEKLPPNVKSIDLIEGAGGSWNFYGISLTQSVDFKKSEKKDTPTKFRVDYQYMSLYDGEKEEWSEWIEKENTFVININDNDECIGLWKHLPKEMTQPVVVYGCPSVATGDPYIQPSYTSDVTISQEQLSKLNSIVNKDEQST